MQSKLIIEFFKVNGILANTSTIWENTYGCAYQYKCSGMLYLISILAYAYQINIDHGVGELGHVRLVVDGLNVTTKEFISMLMSNVKLPGSKRYANQITMHTVTLEKYVSIAILFQKYLPNASR